MPVFRTCRACRFDKTDCDARRNFGQRIALLGITSVKWNCAKRQPLYVPGSPCFAETVPYQQRDEDVEPPKLWFPGVVIWQRSATTFVVFIAEGTFPIDVDRPEDFKFEPYGRGYCKIPLGRMKPRDDALTTLCPRCHDVPAQAGKCHYDHCPGGPALTETAGVPF